MPNAKKPVKRPYRSPYREDLARATRRLVVDAAGRLFSTVGYVATSADAIAEEAGVSRATVFGVGSKPTLLKLAHDFAIGGDDDPIVLRERPRSLAIRAEPDPYQMLAQYAELCADMGKRVALIHEAIRAAAHADPDVAALWRNVNEERRKGSARLVSYVTARTPLREGLAPQAAADVVWVLNDPAVYHMLVHQRGWSGSRYAAWLGEALHRELLPPRDPR